MSSFCLIGEEAESWEVGKQDSSLHVVAISAFLPLKVCGFEPSEECKGDGLEYV